MCDLITMYFYISTDIYGYKFADVETYKAFKYHEISSCKFDIAQESNTPFQLAQPHCVSFGSFSACFF